MTDLRIEHSDEAGTLLEGTSKGDGSAELVKTQGWRWGRSITAWYVPRSRNTPPRRDLIERTSQALQAAGFTVAVSIDATPQAREEAEQRRAAQADARADILTERAQRESAQAEARWTAEQNIGAGIPFGQPILAGHHSQRGAERDRDRMQAHTAAAIEHQRKAARAANAAKVAAAANGARHAPVTVANRIERMAADVRRDERELARLESADRAKTSYGQTLNERLSATRADLAHWQDVRAEQIAQGIATNFGRERVSAGDRVMIRGTWRRVVRANARTVSVETGYSWVDKCPWHEVQHHQPATTDQGSTNA